jgi:hypothetical protein
MAGSATGCVGLQSEQGCRTTGRTHRLDTAAFDEMIRIVAQSVFSRCFDQQIGDSQIFGLE